jgi:hypothetical protein
VCKAIDKKRPEAIPDKVPLKNKAWQKTSWCQYADRKSWNDTDSATMGRCVGYQGLCMSCTGTYGEDNPEIIPGINSDIFYSGQYGNSPFFTETKLMGMDNRPLGSYLQRPTRCDPAQNLICTGDLIPALPAVCVERRVLPSGYDAPTQLNLMKWGKRMLRMGGLNRMNKNANMTTKDQLPQVYT